MTARPDTRLARALRALGAFSWLLPAAGVAAVFVVWDWARARIRWNSPELHLCEGRAAACGEPLSESCAAYFAGWSRPGESLSVIAADLGERLQWGVSGGILLLTCVLALVLALRVFAKYLDRRQLAAAFGVLIAGLAFAGARLRYEVPFAGAAESLFTILPLALLLTHLALRVLRARHSLESVVIVSFAAGAAVWIMSPEHEQRLALVVPTLRPVLANPRSRA